MPPVYGLCAEIKCVTRQIVFRYSHRASYGFPHIAQFCSDAFSPLPEPLVIADPYQQDIAAIIPDCRRVVFSLI